MALINWFESPFTSAERLLLGTMDDLDRRITKRFGTADAYVPNVDISEDKDNFYLIAELPGMTEKNVKVTVDNDTLTITGQKERNEEKRGRNYHRIERSFGEFVRSLSLPTNVKAKAISGSFKDGLLELTMPKIVSEVPASREIPLNTTSVNGNPSTKSNGHLKSEEKAALS